MYKSRWQVRSDTGRFELVVIRPPEVDESRLVGLPRMQGSWRLSAKRAATGTQVRDAQGNPMEIGYRLVGGKAYVRIAFAGSPFGKDCWLKIDPDVPEVARMLPGWKRPGDPAALSLFVHYRPGGHPAPGTARLYDALGAIGFQQLANANAALFRKARIPIDVRLRAGRLYGIIIDPIDLVAAFDALDEKPDGVVQMESSLKETPLLFWGIDYSDFGGRVVVRAPPKVVEVGDPQCDSGT